MNPRTVTSEVLSVPGTDQSYQRPGAAMVELCQDAPDIGGGVEVGVAIWQPKDVETLYAQAPTANEQAYTRTKNENYKVYGTAFDNFQAQLRSVRRVKAMQQRLGAVKRLAGQDQVNSPDHALYVRQRELREQVKTLRATITRGAPGEENDKLQETLVETARKQYESGFITFADFRQTQIGGKQGGMDLIYEATTQSVIKTFGSREEWAKKGRTATDLEKCTCGALTERLTDILLAAPAGADTATLRAFAAAAVEKTITLVSQLAVSDPWLEKPDPQTTAQLVHEHLNAIIYPGYRMELVVGLGGSADSPSIRLPAYISRALEHQERFMRLEIQPPILRIVNAHALSTEINGLDPRTARLNAIAAQELLEAYVFAYYPECAPFTEFTMPGLDQLLPPESAADIAWLHEQQNKDPKLGRAVGALMTRGAVHSNAQGSSASEGTLRYAVAHPVPALFRDWGYASQQLPEAVIKFGGAGEGSFNVVEAALARRYSVLAPGATGETYALNTAGKTNVPVPLHVTQRVGAKPPYYAAGTHEITVEHRSSVIPDSFETLLALYANSNGGDHTLRDLSLLNATHGDGYLAFFAKFARQWQQYDKSGALQNESLRR
jgi:hypothetical protein